MDWLRQLRFRFLALFRRRQFEADMAEELRQHLEHERAARRAAGLDGTAADFAAQRSFGGLEQIKEQARDQLRWAWLETSFQDIHYALRMLRKTPAFSTIVILTLAVGIGANTAFFSTANAILFRPLDFPEPGRLVLLRETDPTHFFNKNGYQTAPANFLAWRKEATSFENLAAVTMVNGSFTLTGPPEPASISGQRVTTNFLSTLRIRPALGRDFLPEEDRPDRANVMILSHDCWMRRFGGRPEVVNETVQLDGIPVTIIGVMGVEFTSLMAGVELWRPIGFTPRDEQSHGNRYLNFTIGRLKPGVTLQQAESELAVIANALGQQFPDTNRGWGVQVKTLHEAFTGDLRPATLALLGAVGFLLLIACANIANLLVARALTRQKETVVRAALGASRGRIVRQFVTESLVFAAIGGTVGLFLAHWGIDLLVAFSPSTPRLNEIRIDGTALAFAAVITLLAGLGVGILPALQVTRIDLIEALKGASRGSTGQSQKVRSLLVVTEIALALMLLIGAGLFFRSLLKLKDVNPGFRTEHALAARLLLPYKKFPEVAQRLAFATQVTERLSSLTGVTAVGAVSFLPLTSSGSLLTFSLPSRPEVDPRKENPSVYYTATPGYLQAMGLQLERGRWFTAQDDEKGRHVAVINEALARKYFPDGDALGQRINRTSQPGDESEIVGIVGNVKHYSLQADETQTQFYEPFAQHPGFRLNFVVRTSQDDPALPLAIRQAIHAVDKDQAISELSPVATLVEKEFTGLGFIAYLWVAFSCTAVALAAIGIYGIMAYFVTQRATEIGIRMALGAQPADVLRLVLDQSGRLVCLGLLAGLGGAFALTRFLGSLLFGVQARDPMTFALVSAALGTVAMIACLVPALRAMKINPITALRGE